MLPNIPPTDGPRERFLRYLGGLSDFDSFYDANAEARAIILGVADCEAILPDVYCRLLFVPMGSTYGEAALEILGLESCDDLGAR